MKYSAFGNMKAGATILVRVFGKPVLAKVEKVTRTHVHAIGIERDYVGYRWTIPTA